MKLFKKPKKEDKKIDPHSLCKCGSGKHYHDCCGA